MQVQAYACSPVKLNIVECLCNTTACYAECYVTLTAKDHTKWAELAEPRENGCWSALDKFDLRAKVRARQTLIGEHARCQMKFASNILRVEEAESFSGSRSCLSAAASFASSLSGVASDRCWLCQHSLCWHSIWLLID